MKGWVGLVGWPVADGLPTLVVTRQRQFEGRTGKVRQSETDVLPLCHATNLFLDWVSQILPYTSCKNVCTSDEWEIEHWIFMTPPIQQIVPDASCQFICACVCLGRSVHQRACRQLSLFWMQIHICFMWPFANCLLLLSCRSVKTTQRI